jgi:hypothetical protein
VTRQADAIGLFLLPGCSVCEPTRAYREGQRLVDRNGKIDPYLRYKMFTEMFYVELFLQLVRLRERFGTLWNTPEPKVSSQT